MPENGDGKDCDKIEQAFKNAVRVFDESAVRVLLYHLEEKYHMRFEPPCPKLEEIEAALHDIAGPAADVIIVRIRAFLR